MDILIVEADRRSVGFARFQRRSGALIFQGADSSPHESPESFAQVLADLAETVGSEERVILSLDPESLFLRELELPLSDRRKQREVLPLELRGEIALDADGLIFDALPSQDGKVIAVWAVEADLEARIAVMKEAGLEPRIVGSSLFAWEFLIPETDSNGSQALSDGRSLAVYSEGRPILFRSLGEGNAADEITRTLALLEAGRGIRVKKVFLHGAAAAAASSFVGRGQSTGVSFALLPVARDLAASFPGENTALEYAGAWALATASLRGEPINFRHGKLAYTAGLVLMKRKLRLSLLLVTLLLVLLMAETGLRYYFVKRDLSSLNTSISQIYREVFPARKKAVDEVSELKSEIRRLGGGAAGQETLPTMSGIAMAKGDGVSGIYELEMGGGQVMLKGDARSFQAANDFKSRLASLCTSSEMNEVKSRPDGSVSFSFRGTLREGTK
jgi:general secretion pathway protein L